MSNAAQQPGRRKFVHHVDTPFSATSWPAISLEDQDTILELLCNLLSPLGQHRRAHIKPSKGKRAARRAARLSPQKRPLPSAPAPSMPELGAKVDVGFNSITKRLETRLDPKHGPGQSYSMVFVARGNQSAAFNCHFPQMIGAASANSAQADKTRLVGFSKPCSERLSSVLGIARVSSVAISRDAPGAQALWEFVQKTVAPVNISWLQDAGRAQFHGTSITSVETSVGSKKIRNM